MTDSNRSSTTPISELSMTLPPSAVDTNAASSSAASTLAMASAENDNVIAAQSGHDLPLTTSLLLPQDWQVDVYATTNALLSSLILKYIERHLQDEGSVTSGGSRSAIVVRETNDAIGEDGYEAIDDEDLPLPVPKIYRTGVAQESAGRPYAIKELHLQGVKTAALLEKALDAAKQEGFLHQGLNSHKNVLAFHMMLSNKGTNKPTRNDLSVAGLALTSIDNERPSPLSNASPRDGGGGRFNYENDDEEDCETHGDGYNSSKTNQSGEDIKGDGMILPPPSHNGVILIVMEHANGGSMKDYLKKFAEGAGDHKAIIKHVMTIFEGVLLGVQSLHSQGVIHRDLKPANIFIKLVDGNPVPKIGDFGDSRILGERLQLDDSVLEDVVGGTSEYASPEVLQLHPQHQSTDIFSLGVILVWCLLFVSTGGQETEFDVSNEEQEETRIEKTRKHILRHRSFQWGDCWDGYQAKSELISLILKMMKENRDSRPSISQVI